MLLYYWSYCGPGDELLVLMWMLGSEMKQTLL